MSDVHPLFQVHMLNEEGKKRAGEMAEAFTTLLGKVEALAGVIALGGRDMAVVRTKLQEASFFAKRAMALNPANQQAL